MKKVMTLMAILAVAVSGMAEAKAGRSSRSFSSSRTTTLPAKPSVMQSQGGTQRTQGDATFSNTSAQPKMAGSSSASSQPAQSRSSTLANFATGAVAGYALSEMLTPTQAKAETNSSAPSQPAEQLVNQPTSLAVPEFQAFDAQNPSLIGRTADQGLYCLNGAMFLINANTNQPAALVDGKGAPLQCKTAL